MQRRPETVVFFGDSLTRADYLDRGFVDILAERWNDVRVLNYGVNGDTSDDLLARVNLVRAEEPDWVWLMIGTNDCGWGLPPDIYRANLLELVRQLRPSRVVMVTPTTSVYYKGENATFVSTMKDVGSDENVPVLDFAAAIEDSDYGLDGLHWNERGHAKLAEAIDRWWREVRSGN